MAEETPEIQLRDALRKTPNLIEILQAKLMEGLDSMDVKTCSYQGHMTWESFIAFDTRLSYIKAIIDIGDLSEVKFAGERDEVMQRLLEGRKRAAANIELTESSDQKKPTE